MELELHAPSPPSAAHKLLDKRTKDNEFLKQNMY